MKFFLANTLVKWFKRLPFAGRQRFWMLYWAYRLTGWHIRHKEWNFVLEYLPPLGKWQKVKVLDVGCSRNLLCHEIVARGYSLMGVDLEKPNFKYPGAFDQADIRHWQGHTFDFVTCISVLEHIEGEDGQWEAMRNMIDCLKIGGRLLLTIPTHEFAQGHPWHGFNQKDLKLPYNAKILEYTERMGQICLCIARTE